MTFPAQGRFKNKLFPHYLISQARKKFNSRKSSNDKNEATRIKNKVGGGRGSMERILIEDP